MPSPAAALRALAADVESAPEDAQAWDRYGEGGAVAAVEAQVAELLGKPAAAMFPSGTMAQQSVLRVWSDRRGSRRVALPELSHLLHHEADGPRLLHGFQYEHLSTGAELPTREALAKIPSPLAAVLLELPLRDAGHLLPSWEDLSSFAALCRERAVPLHFDGARLWESAPYLGHSLAEIAGLADSAYVSFYKGLGGLAGAAVAGPEDVVTEARQWRQRMGGTLFTLQPYAVAALHGLQVQVPRMAEYHDYAVALAERLPQDGISVLPAPPHTNAFRILVPVVSDVVMRRLLRYVEAQRTVLTAPWRPADVPGWSWTEFTVGPATLDWTVDEAAVLLAKVLLTD
ncbi:MAG: beta-eliminating lyase-related protein [Actinomycetota bacterium]|nr:beta-eliminating lyase-related protein [Actinomycetota bacterium]